MTNPFPNLKYVSQRGAYQMVELFRGTLGQADNGAGDLDKNDKSVQLRYDDVVLTAQLPTEKSFLTRHQGKDGTSISLAQIDNGIACITTVSKGVKGYEGARFSAAQASHFDCPYQRFSPEESEFLFSIHDAALRPTKA